MRDMKYKQSPNQRLKPKSYKPSAYLITDRKYMEMMMEYHYELMKRINEIEGKQAKEEDKGKT